MKHYRSKSNARRSRKPKSRNNRRQRTYRYRGGAAGGPAGAAGQIAAVDAAFTGAMGNTVDFIRRATAAAIHGSSCKAAKDHAVSLMVSLGPHDKDKKGTTIVTAAMLATDLAVIDARRQAARSEYLASNVFGHQPGILDTPYPHFGDPKSGPAKPASPRSPRRSPRSPRSH